jgi:hypothetical protein
LRAHPLNKVLYGRPEDNSAYEEMWRDMKARGFDELHPLLVMGDGRVICGCTRLAAARKAKLPEVPCAEFVPTDPATVEMEAELRLIHDNRQRTKTQVMEVREQRTALELQSRLAQVRMLAGVAGDERGRAADIVGKDYQKSGKTITRRIKVLDAIERAQAEGREKDAAKLTTLLEGRNITKALALLEEKKPDRPKVLKTPRVEVPRTFNDHLSRGYSELFEALAKAQVPGELDQVEGRLRQLHQDLSAARRRLAGPALA